MFYNSYSKICQIISERLTKTHYYLIKHVFVYRHLLSIFDQYNFVIISTDNNVIKKNKFKCNTSNNK